MSSAEPTKYGNLGPMPSEPFVNPYFRADFHATTLPMNHGPLILRIFILNLIIEIECNRIRFIGFSSFRFWPQRSDNLIMRIKTSFTYKYVCSNMYVLSICSKWSHQYDIVRLILYSYCMSDTVYKFPLGQSEPLTCIYV